MLNEPISGNKSQTSDFMRVLMALKANVMRDLNCAEIAVVKKIDNDIVYCTYINNSKLTVTCASLLGISVNVGDAVLILFTNSDFRANLNRLKQNQSLQDKSSDSLHSSNYGVIIGKLFEKEEQ